MGEAVSAETVSITTGKTQTLFLDEKDQQLIRDSDVIIVDDVISTGSTLTGMKEIISSAGGRVSQIAAVFTEGDNWSDVISLGKLPVFTE
jgi:adenine phosphoribosyltransferase